MEHLRTKTPCFCTCILYNEKKFLEFSETHSAFCFGKITFGECRKSEKSFISSILKGEREEKSIEFLKSLSINFIRKSSEKML